MPRQPLDSRTWTLCDEVDHIADGTFVCHLSVEGFTREEVAQLITAAPQLAAALSASIEALQEVAVHIPPHSTADIVAARAVTLAYEALGVSGAAIFGKEK